MAELLYQGHGSYRFITNENKVIYLDPYAGKGYDLIPNLVLVTHEHYDHNNLSLLQLASDTIIIRSKDAITKDGLYRAFKNDWIKVTACPASNANHNIKDCVGYILEFDNLKIYCAGDTSYLPFMQDVLPKMKLDYAFLPTDGVYNMNAMEASKCASIIQARHTIPVHMLPGGLFSEEVAKNFITPSSLILHPGEKIEL